MFGTWYTTSFHSRLVVYQVPNLKAPYHYMDLVRLCLGSVVIRPAKKSSVWGYTVLRADFICTTAYVKKLVSAHTGARPALSPPPQPGTAARPPASPAAPPAAPR